MKKHSIGNFEIIEYTGCIFVIKNILDTSFCKTFINYIDSCKTYELDYGEEENVKGYQVELFKSHIDINNAKQKLIYKFITDVLINIYIKCIVNIMLKIKSEIFGAELPKFDSILIRKITDATKIHYDGILNGDEIRCLTCIMALNDDYENGRIYFEEQNVNFKLDRGDVLLFPPYWTHNHSVEKPLNNYRYTITFWFHDYISKKGYILGPNTFPV
tara:strand:+ start:158 stop:805 length:648 start_codon:yes stop_codon:yes gene_type:complete